MAITLPPLLVLLVEHSYKRTERWSWSQGTMRGVSLAVISLLLTVIWTILRQPGVDWVGWLIAIGAFGLVLSRRVNIVGILALGGVAGYLVYH